MLTYYELDLGLNHVVRKWSEPTDPRANLLVQVPGGQLASSDRFDGPSGVLVCCEDHIIYRHMDAPQHRVPIPRRQHPLEDPERGLIIVAAVMHKMKVRSCSTFFSWVSVHQLSFPAGRILLLIAKRRG
jgi:splicing factor 3B subunit 3